MKSGCQGKGEEAQSQNQATPRPPELPRGAGELTLAGAVVAGAAGLWLWVSPLCAYRPMPAASASSAMENAQAVPPKPAHIHKAPAISIHSERPPSLHPLPPALLSSVIQQLPPSKKTTRATAAHRSDVRRLRLSTVELPIIRTEGTSK
jgi:hypothetical protein